MRQGGLILAAGRVRSRKKKRNKNPKKSAPPKTHFEIHSSPATATTSKRPTRKHVPRVSPYVPASIDPGFVEIGHVQLTISKNDECYTYTQTDNGQTLNNGTQ